MPWTVPTLRQRREEVRDDINAHLEGADARVPNSVLRVHGDAVAGQTSDLDGHLAYIARMMMPDTAEGAYADRWANIWLPDGRKAATYAGGPVTITGEVGAAVATGAVLTDGAIEYTVDAGVTLAASSGNVNVTATTPGVAGNLATARALTFVSGADAAIDAGAVVAAPGFAGGADQETDADLIARYIDRIQRPPHGGRASDYPQWAKEVAGVTRAWGTQDMGVGTYTVRFMADVVRAADDGVPTSGDVDLVAAYLATVRPVTVADLYVLAPVKQVLDVTVTDLSSDTPETRTAVETELAQMLLARAAPGQKIYGSWISEAISSATGEDYHSGGYSDVTPTTGGHIIVLGEVTYA